jgi:hypothetical protein
MNKFDEAKHQCKILEELKYDGIAGKLPSWIPEPLKRKFKITRINLFVEAPANYGPVEISRDFHEYIDMLNGKGAATIPAIYHDKFDTLSQIQEIVRLGSEKGLSYWAGEKINKDIQRGKKVVAGGKKGTETYHGNEKEKKEERLGYQRAVDRLHAKRPYLSHNKICEILAPEFEKSTKTIQRHTQNPHKK